MNHVKERDFFHLFQTSLRYNILPQKEEEVPFALKIDALPKNCEGSGAHRKFQINISIR